MTILSAFGRAGGAGAGGGLGSGFVVSGDGEIATNAHVVTTGEGAVDPQGRARSSSASATATRSTAKIVGFDPFSDVALIKVDPEGLTLRPLPLGSSADVEVGAPVAAIGSPFGEEQSLSSASISATDRSIESLTGFATTGALQTDAAINSGNSGGPLLDAGGRVLGINSQIRSASGVGSGVGFAVPVDVVRRSLDQLRRERAGRATPTSGVSTQGVYPQLADALRPRDASAARGSRGRQGRAGRRGGVARRRRGARRSRSAPWRVGGDIITKVDGLPIRRDADLAPRAGPPCAGRPGRR